MESPLKALHVVDVGRHDFGAQFFQLFRFPGQGVSRQGSDRVSAALVPQDRAAQSASLRTGGTNNSDDLPAVHGNPPFGALSGPDDLLADGPASAVTVFDRSGPAKDSSLVEIFA
jgi:hypothetical protein